MERIIATAFLQSRAGWTAADLRAEAWEACKVARADLERLMALEAAGATGRRPFSRPELLQNAQRRLRAAEARARAFEESAARAIQCARAEEAAWRAFVCAPTIGGWKKIIRSTYEVK